MGTITHGHSLPYLLLEIARYLNIAFGQSFCARSDDPHSMRHAVSRFLIKVGLGPFHQIVEVVFGVAEVAEAEVKDPSSKKARYSIVERVLIRGVIATVR
jgi:hypothetical protein